MQKALRCFLLLAFLLADLRRPFSPQDDIINRVYSDLLYPGQMNLLFSPLPPISPALCGAGAKRALLIIIIMSALAVPLIYLDNKYRLRFKYRSSVSDTVRKRASKRPRDLFPTQRPLHTSCDQQDAKKGLPLLLTLCPLGVVGMLLIMAGDVEQNPGPLTRQGLFSISIDMLGYDKLCIPFI